MTAIANELVEEPPIGTLGTPEGAIEEQNEPLTEAQLTDKLIEELRALPFVKNVSQAGEMDDGKNPVEALCALTVTNATDAAAVIAILNTEPYQHHFGAMGKGALTNAIGAMKTHDAAEKVGFIGFIAISIDFGGASVDGGEGHLENSDWVDVSTKEAENGHTGWTILFQAATEDRMFISPSGDRHLQTKDGAEFNVVEAIPGKLVVYLSRHNKGSRKHRYRLYGGISPERVDQALAKFGLTTHNDLTTRRKVPWSSTIANASEGRTRRNVADSLLNLKRVDAHGVHVDVGAAAKIHVGLLGATGVVVEATHEAVNDGAKEFGIMVHVNPGTPIDLGMDKATLRAAITEDPQAVYRQLMDHPEFEGKWIAGLRAMTPVVEALRPFGTYKETTDPTTHDILTRPAEGDALLRGEEIIELDVLLFSIPKIHDPIAKNRAIAMAMEMIETGCTTTLMVDGKTDQLDTLKGGIINQLGTLEEKTVASLQHLRAQELSSSIRYACGVGEENDSTKATAAYQAALTAASGTLSPSALKTATLGEEERHLTSLLTAEENDAALAEAEMLLQNFPVLQEEEGTEVPPLVSALKRLLDNRQIHLNMTSGVGLATDPRTNESFREIREATAEGPRSTADIGISSSLDCSSATKNEIGTIKVNERYLQYMLDRRRKGWLVFVYGHENPNGINWHGRSAFPFKGKYANPARQEEAAERRDDLDSANASLYADLISFDGTDDIDVRAGEKGLAGKDLTFFRYLELTDPETAEKVYQALQAAGPMFAARSSLVFHAHPMRMKDSIMNRFVQEGDPSAPLLHRVSGSIARTCQHSHRDIVWGKIDQEMYGQLRDWLDLKLDERISVNENPERAVHAAIVNVVNFVAGETYADLRDGQPGELETNVSTVLISDPAHLDHPALTGKRKILCCTTAAPLTEADRRKADVIIYSAQNFGNEQIGHPGGPLGITVTNTQTIIHAYDVKKAGNTISSLDFYGNHNDTPFVTTYTPDLETRAELAVAIAALRGEKCILDPSKAAAMLQREKEFVTMNPGPSQGNPGILEHTSEIDAEVERLQAEGPEAYTASLASIEAKVRAYFGVPEGYEIVFARSATEMMERVGVSLDSDKATVISKGAFGRRQHKMVAGISKNKPPKKITIRGGRGENSEYARILREIKGQDREDLFLGLTPNDTPIEYKAGGEDALDGEGSVFYMTENETSEGTQMDPPVICEPLDPQTLTVVDATSDIGSRKPKFLREDGTPMIDVYFGSGQKILGIPGGGICMAFISKRAMSRARLTEAQKKEERVIYNEGLAHLAQAKREGRIDVRKMVQLGASIDHLTALGGVEEVSALLRRRIARIYEAIAEFPDLAPYVPMEVDRSQVMVTLAASPEVDIAGVNHDLRQANKAGGAGYGVLKAEHFRLLQTPYLTDEQFEGFLALLIDRVRNNRMPGAAVRPWSYSVMLDNPAAAQGAGGMVN